MAASLYRSHRPRTFADVVGQEHVVRTLRNAIAQDKVHHAYLFIGSRGTGKTSMAKILAASLNCVKGPTTEPDGTCESCRAIASASSLDVIEMDAASNNSVDDIRDLREKVSYAPVSGRYKVYILDEAHMLTPQAWNAFLKTLEEPPPNTIFVLATTEVQKILPTVADRCHRFDFSRPTIQQIGSVLRRVADSEGIQAPDEALALVARSATGSFRDALGTLEQLVSYSGTQVAVEDVLAVLGAADDELLFGTVDAIAGASPRDALLQAARLAESGRDVERFFRDLETHLRGLMVVQTLGEVPTELSMTPETDARLLEQAQRVGPVQVTYTLDLLGDGLRAMKDGADARTQLELALIKAADPVRDASQKALLARLERLERGAPQAPAPVRAPQQPQTPAAQAAQRPQPGVAQPAPGPAQLTPGPAPQAPAPVQEAAAPARVQEAAAPARVQEAAAHAPMQEAAAHAPMQEAAPPAPVQEAAPPAYEAAQAAPPAQQDAPPPRHETPPHHDYDAPPVYDDPGPAWQNDPGPQRYDDAPAPQGAPPRPYGEPAPDVEAVTVATDRGDAVVAATPIAPVGDNGYAIAVTPVDGSLDLAGFREVWPAVLSQLSDSLGSFLADAVPVALDTESVTIAFAASNDILHRMADRPANRDQIKAAVRAVTGRALALKIEKREDEEMDVEDQMSAMSEDELIDRVVQEFDATVLEEEESP